MTTLAEKAGAPQQRSLPVRLKGGDEVLLVGLDVSKTFHVAALASSRGSDGRRPRSLRLANDRDGFEKLEAAIREETAAGCGTPVVCGVEPTGRYHKALCAWLESRGYEVCLVSGVAAAANRKTILGTWDHHDASDAENVVDLMRQGKVLHRVPTGDAYAELRIRVATYRDRAKSLARCRVKLRNTLATGFPEVEALFDDDILHADLLRLLRLYPTARAVAAEDEARFVTRCLEGWRKSTSRTRRLREVHALALRSVGYSDGPAYRREVFALLDEITFHQHLLEVELQNLETACSDFRGWRLLQTIPGVGPKLAAVILAEIGDPHSYASIDQVLRLAGLNLCQARSGTSRNSPPVVSHAGKAQLRWALWVATCCAVSKDDPFKARYSFEIRKRGGPARNSVKKPSLVKLMAKLLRIAFAILRDEIPYDPALFNSDPT